LNAGRLVIASNNRSPRSASMGTLETNILTREPRLSAVKDLPEYLFR
jgi:hypothetical protein